MDGFLLKKVISNAVHLIPAAFFILLLTVLLFRWAPKLFRLIQIIVISLLLALSSAPVTNVLVSSLENQHEVLQNLPEDTALILVLGSGHHYAEERPPNSVLTTVALSRLAEGVRLWQTKPDAVLMLSGAKFFSEISHAEAMRNAAIQMGVAESQIILASESLDTADEIVSAAEWLIVRKVPNARLVVVSSAMHLPRATLMLQDHAVAYTMAPTDFRISNAPWYRFSAGFLRDADAALHEYVGMLWHRLAAKN